MTGKTVSHYEIQEKLGSGGMGVVYRARDTRLERDVALKFLPPHLASNEDSRNRFKQEARAASALDHPNICTIFDIDETDDGQTFIAMGYYRGTTLSEMAGDGELTVEHACSLVRQIAAGLARAHDRGIIHRDIKPSNILVTDDGVAKILDFGLAKLSGKADITRDGSTVGTASYMSPEQTRGEHVDGRTDIWSLAVVLFELLTGRKPFDGDYEHAITYSILNEEAPSANSIRPGIDEGLSDIIAKCLTKNPRDRWSSMRDLHAALGQYADEDPSTVGVGSSGSDANPLRTTIVFSVAAAVTLALVYVLMLGLGLPDWVFPTAVILILAGFPVMFLASNADRRRTRGKTGFTASRALDKLLTVRKASLGGLGVFAGLALVVAAYMFMRTTGIGPFATLVSSGTLNENPTVLVAEFDNLTADSTISQSVSEALRIDLSQSDIIQIVDRNTIAHVLQRMNLSPGVTLDTPTSIEVAEREGTDVIVSGEVSQLGTGYVLALRLLQTSDRTTLLSLRQTASDPTDLIPAVDRLSQELRQKIGESIKNVRDSPPLYRVTTESLDALKHYTRSEKYFSIGDYEAAQAELNLAIEVDSTFAMAYRKLAAAANNLQQEAESRWAAAQAYRYRDRLSPVEKLLTEAYYYNNVENEPEIEIRLYERILEERPNNDIALNNVSILYSHFGENEKARANLEKLLTLYGPESSTWANLAVAHWGLQNLDEAARVIDSLKALREDPRYWFFAGVSEYYLGNLRAADSLAKLTAEATRNSGLESIVTGQRAALHEVQGRIRAADEIRDEMRSRFPWNEDILYSYIAQALTYALVLDKPEESRRLLSTGLRLHPIESIDSMDRPYEFLAIGYAIAGLPDSTRAVMEVYQVTIPADRRWDNEPQIELALADLADNNAAAALPALERAASYGWSLPTFFLGVAYQKLGRAEDAITTYEKYLNSYNLHRYSTEGSLRITSLRRLAELYIEAGQTDKAVEKLAEFVNLWQNADPELQPMVQEARDQIDRLLAGQLRESS